MRGKIETVHGDQEAGIVTQRIEVEAELFGPWAVHGKIMGDDGATTPRGHWMVTHRATGYAATETARKADAVDLARRMRDASFDPSPNPQVGDRRKWRHIRAQWAKERALEPEDHPYLSRKKWYPTEDSPR